MENYNEVETKKIEEVSESSVKKLSFKIQMVPIIVSLLVALLGLAVVTATSERLGNQPIERRETCLYSDDINWETDVENLKNECGGELISGDEMEMTYMFDGMDAVYEGDTETHYVFEEGKLEGVVAYIPYTPERMDEFIKYYDAEVLNDEGSYYTPNMVGNVLIFSKTDDKITCVITKKN